MSIPSQNTGTATLTIPGATSKPIAFGDGGPLPYGALGAGQLVIFSYDGTYWQISEGPVSALMSVEQFGAVSDGMANDYLAIKTADNMVSSGSVVFASGKIYAINTYTPTPPPTLPTVTSLTISSRAIFAPGSKVIVGAGMSVIFQQSPDAGAYQIFSGPGTVSVLGKGYAEWFGASGDNKTDDSTAINTAISSCLVVELLARVYYIGSTTIGLTGLTPRSLIGAGMDITFITFMTGSMNQDCIFFDGIDAVHPSTSDASSFEISGFTIINVSGKLSSVSDPSPPSPLPGGGAAIHVHYCSYAKISDIKIWYCSGGLWMTTLENPVVDRLVILHCVQYSIQLSDAGNASDWQGGVTNGEFSNIFADGSTSPTNNVQQCVSGLLIQVYGDYYMPSAKPPIPVYLSYNEAIVFNNCNFLCFMMAASALAVIRITACSPIDCHTGSDRRDI